MQEVQKARRKADEYRVFRMVCDPHATLCDPPHATYATLPRAIGAGGWHAPRGSHGFALQGCRPAIRPARLRRSQIKILRVPPALEIALG